MAHPFNAWGIKLHLSDLLPLLRSRRLNILSMTWHPKSLLPSPDRRRKLSNKRQGIVLDLSGSGCSIMLQISAYFVEEQRLCVFSLEAMFILYCNPSVSQLFPSAVQFVLSPSPLDLTCRLGVPRSRR
jgi:hypothetical protein